MAENKTRPTDASVVDYIAERGGEQQRVGARRPLTRSPGGTLAPPADTPGALC